MPRQTTHQTERLGVNAVERLVLEEFRWVWREQPNSDFGVDGQIEVVDNEGKPTGQLFAAQIKAGASYFRGSGETIPFYVDEGHMRYWEQHSLPVLLILHHPDEQQTLWQWATLQTARATQRGWCIDIPRTKVFGGSSKPELLDRVWEDDSIGLRRRFALDRQFMKTFEDRDRYVRIDQWVNKHLQYREIMIYFDDPDKDSPDMEIPIMATWDFEVRDIMWHFLPWLDYDYFEEPDDSCAEIDSHVFEVWLSGAAKAFLQLEAFFESNPKPPEADEVDEIEYDDEWVDAHLLDDEP